MVQEPKDNFPKEDHFRFPGKPWEHMIPFIKFKKVKFSDTVKFGKSIFKSVKTRFFSNPTYRFASKNK